MWSEQNELSNTPYLGWRYCICFGAKGAVSSLAWGIPQGSMVPKTAALKAPFISGAIETRFQRLFPRRFEFLGRCPRLPVNAALLALNAS